jgi:hypothetical protein
MPQEQKQWTALADRLRKCERAIDQAGTSTTSTLDVLRSVVLEQVKYVAGVLELLDQYGSPAEPMAPEHVPALPHYVATIGAEPKVLVTRAWEAGYRAGVSIARFWHETDRGETGETLGDRFKRKCLMLAVECVGDLARLQPFRDELRRTPVEDVVARFLELAMLAHGNILAEAESSARAAARAVMADPVDVFAMAREALDAERSTQPDRRSPARKLLGEVATLLQRVEVMQRDGVDATPEKLELLGKALLMLEERITLDEDETGKRLAALERELTRLARAR